MAKGARLQSWLLGALHEEQGNAMKLKKGDIFTISGLDVGYGKKGQKIVCGRNVATGRKMKSATPVELIKFVVTGTPKAPKAKKVTCK